MIKVVVANLTRDTDVFGEMDPFVTIEYQGMEFKTKTIRNGGKRPQWNEIFEIDLFSLSDDIKISIIDENVIKNDLVGEKTVNL
jgi:Ca2+-dependent lipid-binding protein